PARPPARRWVCAGHHPGRGPVCSAGGAAGGEGAATDPAGALPSAEAQRYSLLGPQVIRV
ncbi:transcriptional regulator, partial [Streptomyces niveus]